MAVIAPPTGSTLNKWYAVVGIGLALTVPPITSYMMTSGAPMATTMTLAYGPQSISHTTHVSTTNHTPGQSKDQTVYQVPQNLGLPNRREPGGTR